MTAMMKRTRGLASSTWKRWTNPQKTEEAAVNDICPCCGARSYFPRTSAKDIAISVLCSALLLAIAIPAAWATEQWMQRESHRILNHMMIWHEPIETWNR
jgi:hypothetical protein